MNYTKNHDLFVIGTSLDHYTHGEPMTMINLTLPSFLLSWLKQVHHGKFEPGKDQY